MPAATKPSLLPPFSAAVTQAGVEASTEIAPAYYIINVLIEIGGYLLSLDEKTTLFGRLVQKPYSPTLRTLYTRLHTGYLNPSPMQSHANETARIKATLGQRTAKDAVHRPLEDFEDVYYAILARMQDIHQTLNARLGSGFSTFSDPVHTNGPSIADFYVDLAQYWGALNEKPFVKAIDCAVRRSRVKYLHQEVVAQLHEGDITQADADEILDDLYDPDEYDGIQGVAWINGWAPSMVAAWLEEKYRIVMQVEKEDAESKKEETTTKLMDTVKHTPSSQYEMKLEKKGERKVSETLNHANMTGVEVKTAEPVDQQAWEQLMRDHQRQQDELNYMIEWQIKAQRVSEYTRYLRSMASHDVRYIVDSNAAAINVRKNGFGGPVQRMGNVGVDMRASRV
ncbi:hypothetical protein OPT61_g928 [Boeremia exigua]|uniref:Uncharacterized protein n=1 Tax=Boeremia exigua TaxID=749465 RepID=A0ACC2IRZ5_9PLEO|nr:hypothetical protein OPT61_g928 [Boeremia exigua]